MTNMDLVEGLKLGATGLAGLFAGCAMYINAADHPSRMTLDIRNNRQAWKENFNRAKKFQGAMCFLGSSCAAAVYYLDTESSSRKLWLLGSGVFITIWPYTALVMLPDIYKNLKDDVLETRGEQWVRNHIIRWNKQHGVRTVLGMAAFGIFLYALSKN